MNSASGPDDQVKRDRTRPDGDWNHQIAELQEARLHYVREGKGRPVFLLHGWPEFWWTWHRNIPALEKHFDLIVPDLQGFGDSRSVIPDEGRFADARTHAADVLALADALGHRTFWYRVA
jgi:pimeloyl-ACP methyl ester carboxylesterase